jgi:hypothetical protein
MTTIINATLHADEIASAAGITVHHRTPILALARKLLAAGHNPEAVLVPTWADGQPSLQP